MFWATIPAVDGLEIPFGGVLIGFISFLELNLFFY